MAQPPPCPYCGASAYRFRDERWLVCGECAHEFDLQRDLCRRCGWVNRVEARFCTHCDAPLPHDPVDRLIAARGRDRRMWRTLAGELDTQGKQIDIQASEDRMQVYLEEDRAIREAQAHALAAQRLRERRMLIVVGVLAAVVIGLLLALALLSPLRELARPGSAIPGGGLPGGWGALAARCHSYRTALG